MGRGEPMALPPMPTSGRSRAEQPQEPGELASSRDQAAARLRALRVCVCACTCDVQVVAGDLGPPTFRTCTRAEMHARTCAWHVYRDTHMDEAGAVHG